MEAYLQEAFIDSRFNLLVNHIFKIVLALYFVVNKREAALLKIWKAFSSLAFVFVLPQEQGPSV